MKAYKLILQLGLVLTTVLALTACSTDGRSTVQTTESTEKEITEATGATDLTETTESTAITSTNEIALSDSVVYTNEQYGISVALPESWDGFSVVDATWVSEPTDANENGPEIILRHPEWTESDPTQDFPILVFTKEQWQKVESEIFTVSAAPIPPTQLAENDSYVFALPPRYNFSYLKGYEEVEAIIKANPITTFN
ncbi:MAG: hypothetical protein BGO41_12225 [Clostridiales bacterium 38-18]|nr:MAG: hypothetical protein BGO41_12225 [Clostridiales bacterium 38-18]